MFTFEIVLAAALLTAPKDVTVDSSWLEVMRPTLLSLALSGELIDPRERTQLFTQDLTGDLAMLQSRHDEFKSYPSLGECNRFPERKLVNDLLAMNRSCRNDFNTRLAVDLNHMEDLKTAICDCDQLYQVWDTVRDAQCDYYYVTVRRQALKLLRDLIGDEAFYLGQLPPNVPVWHFPRR